MGGHTEGQLGPYDDSVRSKSDVAVPILFVGR